MTFSKLEMGLKIAYEAAMTMRINKYLAECGVASRRGADEIIAQGRVSLNGVPVEGPGVQVDPDSDRVAVDGKPVSLLRETVQGADVTLMLHKPVQVVTTARDPQGRTTVFDILPDKYRKLRLLHVGRLDYFSEGLLLLTTDGSLCNRLIHPRWHLPKVYHVLVRGEVRPDCLEAMRQGMTLAEGEQLAPVEVRVLPSPPPHSPQSQPGTWLSMTLLQGLNRQIRRMCRDCGLTVLKLIRVSQGQLELGRLERGKARELTPAEVSTLRRAVGLENKTPPADARGASNKS